MDPDIDFAALFGQFDTLLMGRRTFEAMAAQSGGGMPGMKVVVFSKTLRPSDHPKVTIVSEHPEKTVAELKAQKSGKDIWLFGGGALFRSFLELGLVDAVEPAVIPVLLGGGIPLLPAPAARARLKLTGHKLYPKSGIVLLGYAVR